VNVLDENIIESQRQMLRNWRIPVRQIGHELGRKGMADEEIIPFLLTLKRPSFFTRDLGFYQPQHCHLKYCIVTLPVRKEEAAHFIRRFLAQPGFHTQLERVGAVVRVTHAGLALWRLHGESEQRLDWIPARHHH